jgi:hypothetical protein
MNEQDEDKGKVKKSDEEIELEQMLASIEKEKKAKRREERAKKKLLREKKKKEREMRADDESGSEESSESTESVSSSENKMSNNDLGDGADKKSIESDYIRSNDVVSAIAGTSKKETGSVRNARRNLRKIGEEDEEEEVETQIGSKTIIKKKKKIPQQFTKDSYEDDNYYVKISSLYNDTDQGNKSTKNSEDFDLNDYMPDTVTFFQDKHDENDPIVASSLRSKLKKTALTVLLTQKFRTALKSDDPKKSQLMSIRYQPTYRLESKTNFKSLQFKIEKKIRQTLEALCEKYEKYDTEYTPKFLRVITDLVKNDAKSFKLDRYKIISHVSLLTKMSNQDMFYISRTLFNKDLDHKICLKCETKTFYVICLVFFVYCD